MIRKRSRPYIIFLCFALPLFSFLTLTEIMVHQTISTVFEVLPMQRWVLSRGTEGQIISTEIDYKSAISNNLSVIQFERGESMNFRLSPSILQRSSLSQGDTIAMLYSSELQEKLAKLTGSLNVTQADLAAKSAGEKKSLIDEVKKRVEYSEARVKEKRAIQQRKEELYKKEYISLEEYDAAVWDLKLAEIENGLYQAQLDVTMSGSKKEELEVYHSTIRSYTNEIELLKKRLRDFIITSPISGDIIRIHSKDTLLIINNTSTVILSFPLRYGAHTYVTEGDSIRFELRNINAEMTGVLVAVSQEVQIVNGVQMMFARIACGNSGHQLIPGLNISGKLILPKITLFEYFSSLFDH